eukprot:gene19351-23169_t
MGNDRNTTHDNVLGHVAQSAQWMSENSKSVSIDYDMIDKFISELSQDEYESMSSHVQFPLNFADHKQEVTFWFILDLINIGSGYRRELHAVSERGAYETICYGLFGMFLSQSGKLDNKFLSSMSIHEVSSYFNIPVSVEVEHQPCIYKYIDSPLKPLVVNIHHILRESAEICTLLGFQDFGSLVYKYTEPALEGPSAAALVSQLVNLFPAFADRTVYTGGQQLAIYKKAQLLAADLYRRFKDVIPERFNFTDINDLTVFTDNVLPAVLRKLNILTITDATLAAQIDAGTELAPGDQEAELRVLAIHASRSIVNRAHLINPNHFIVNDVKLDYYLWTKGKDAAFRTFERHYTKQTLFY